MSEPMLTLMTTAPLSTAHVMPAAMSLLGPLPLALSTRTGRIVTSGATPTTPTPFSPAPMIPATCVPCPLTSVAPAARLQRAAHERRTRKHPRVEVRVIGLDAGVHDRDGYPRASGGGPQVAEGEGLVRPLAIDVRIGRRPGCRSGVLELQRGGIRRRLDRHHIEVLGGGQRDVDRLAERRRDHGRPTGVVHRDHGDRVGTGGLGVADSVLRRRGDLVTPREDREVLGGGGAGCGGGRGGLPGGAAVPTPTRRRRHGRGRHRAVRRRRLRRRRTGHHGQSGDHQEGPETPPAGVCPGQGPDRAGRSRPPGRR